MTNRFILLAAFSAVLGFSAPAAASDRSFIIPSNDGYGIADCLGEGGACGRMVADAWCAAQGLGKAIAFGPAEASEMTASLRATATRSAAQAYMVTCKE